MNKLYLTSAKDSFQGFGTSGQQLRCVSAIFTQKRRIRKHVETP